MKIAIEISMYPFQPDYEAPILAFIGRLSTYEGIQVEVNSMSTQLFGLYDILMDAIKKEVKSTFEEKMTTVMVMKILHVPTQNPLG
jgi:uncharacterized protein YqgV (UPF0045/DUF77 family)